MKGIGKIKDKKEGLEISGCRDIQIPEKILKFQWLP
jgi:hypothetical protein